LLGYMTSKMKPLWIFSFKLFNMFLPINPIILHFFLLLEGKIEVSNMNSSISWMKSTATTLVCLPGTAEIPSQCSCFRN
jgi:hypothetical protein